MKVFPLSLPLTVLIDSGLYGLCEVVGGVGEEMNGGETAEMRPDLPTGGAVSRFSLGQRKTSERASWFARIRLHPKLFV